MTDVTIVTSAECNQIYGKVRWLEYMGLGSFTLTVIPFGKTKEGLDFDICVDDRPDTIERVIKAGKIGIVYDQPWNQDCKVGHRVRTIYEASKYIEGLT